MAVNLLPQTPPNHADTRAAPKPDDAAAADAPTFSETLVAAAKVVIAKPASATASALPAIQAADAKAPRTWGDDELTALLMSAPATFALDATPVLAPGLRLTPEPLKTPVAKGDEKPVDVPAEDVGALLVASLNLLTQHMGVPLRTAPAAVDATGSTHVAPLRGEARRPESFSPEQLAVPAPAAERVDASAPSSTRTIGVEFAANALRAAHEPKASAATDAAIPLTGSEIRTVNATPAPAPVPVTVSAPAFTPAWRDEITQHLTQFVMMRQDRAEIRLHPANLGPISVQIQIDGGQANLLIHAPQAVTRDGLELALPQLRDSLAQQGITLGETNIRDQRQPDQQSGERGASLASAKSMTASIAAPEAPVRVRLGLIDLFA